MALIFKSVLEAGDTFGDTFEDTTGTAKWYQLWVGDGETGNYVQTGSGDKGWVKATNIDSLEIDFAQFGDSVLWVREYAAGVTSDWVSGAVDFSAPTEGMATDEVDGNVPLAQMFEDLNVADGTRYQIWNGDAAGEQGAYLDTADGKGWLDAADINEYFYQAEAFNGDQDFNLSFAGAGNDELWIKTEVNGVSFGWEHWTVGPVVVEPVANELAGVDMGDGVVGLHVDTTLGDLVGQDGGTMIDADDTDASVLRLTGDADIRVDFTNPADQVKGLDLDGNGQIDFDGIENDLSDAGVMTVANFTVVDAYARNVKNHDDLDNNFFGDLDFDGTGFQGDGVDTDGNIVLGGLGNDTIYGGIGNDFIAGGGSVTGWDELSGGRNADFFFVELSDLDPTDGDRLDIDGGVTFDDDAGQDSDWVLGEFSDDDEPVTVELGSNGEIYTRSGVGADIDDIENFDASGNLYGFLNDYDVVLGGLGEFKDAHAADGTENYGLGSTAQLLIDGSSEDNIIVGGYDNDTILGFGGDDVLFGGNMQFLEDNQNNPNILEIPNDGRDVIFGGSGDDDIHFEMDGGVYEGDNDENADGGNDDTLWLTDYTPGASTSTLADMTEDNDNVVRIDLGVGMQGGLANYAGYGGADENYSDGDYTADQTNYTGDYDRAQVQDFENVNATGLGSIDYDTDGTNESEQNFTSQMNFNGLEADLDLRGTTGANSLYANTGTDNLEGREGNDNLMGGEGNDDFIFYLDGGDDLDIIHRLSDVDNDKFWDGTFEQDFGVNESSETGDSTLNLFVEETGAPGNELANLTVTEISSVIFDADGDIAFALDTPEIRAAATYDQLLTAVQNAIAADAAIADTLTATLVGSTIVLADAEGREMADAAPDAFFSVSGNNVDITVAMDYGQAETLVSEDRLIFAAYEDRADGELVDDDGMVNHTGDAVSLGTDGYAEDLVARFDSDGNLTTVLAEDQAWAMTFTNLADEDTVTISVNGTAYSLKVGVAADGTAIPGDYVAGDFTDFLDRLTALINAGSDNDTLAGSLVAARVDNTITLTQGNYNGGQVVFMDEPVVTLGNLSGGEKASVAISNGADSEITLFEFDGRNGNLDAANVLFLGGSGMNEGEVTNADNSRSIFATAGDAGGELLGSDALILDSMTDTDTVATDFVLHGHDAIFTGIGDDVVSTGTGDDTIYGSIGDDIVDGGKDIYVVQSLVAGEVVETAEVMNDYEAAVRLLEADVLAVDLINEDAVNGPANGYADTLVFSTNDFSGTQFTVTIDDDLAQMEGGAGTVGVDEGDNGTIDHLTTFTEMEAIRTLAGDGTHAGQGHDTLDVEALSDAAALTAPLDPDAGIVYNMTSDLGYVDVWADFNNDDTVTEKAEFIAVDGVENLLGGNGNDWLNIDESEVNKDNRFDGDDDIAELDGSVEGDMINYDHTDMDNNGEAEGAVLAPAEALLAAAIANVDAGNAWDLGIPDPGVASIADDVWHAMDDAVGTSSDILDAGEAELAAQDEAITLAMRPSLTIAVEAANDTDTVSMTGGTIVGNDTTVDTLVDVETIDVTFGAISRTLDDTVDVRGIIGATVDYVTEQVLDGAVVEANILGLTEVENVMGSTGADRVVVANDMSQERTVNSRNDDTAISFASFLDYDTFDAADDRVAFSAIDADDRSEANNQNLFTFDGGDGVDRVDYAAVIDNIAAVVNLEDGEVSQNVFVTGADLELTAVDDRIDLLLNIEEVVASAGDSVLDFTGSGTNLAISYMAAADATASADYADTREHTISIEDLDSSIPFGNFSFIELMDDADGDLVVGETALWNQIEGSDNDETVELTDDQSADVHTFNLRGGANEVNYNELTKGIELSIDSIAAGVTTVNIQAKDTAGAVINAGDVNSNGIIDGMEIWSNYDRISSYNSNRILGDTGSLRIEASQSENDSIDLTGVVSNNLILLGASEGLSDVIKVSFTTAANDVEMVLTGFENLTDGAGDDDYVIEDLSDFVNTLSLSDNAIADTDTLILTDGALEDINPPLTTDWSDDTVEFDTFLTDLAGLNPVADLDMDFAVYDVRRLTAAEDAQDFSHAAAAVTDTIILGDLDNVGAVDDFSIIALSNDATNGNSATAGDTFVFDLDAGVLTGGADSITFDTAFTLDTTRIDDDVTVTVESAAAASTVITGAGDDTITGGAGADSLTGGEGADTLSGGVEVGEVHTLTLSGTVLDAVVNFGLTFGDAATGVIDEGDEIAAGGDVDQVGQAVADFDWSAVTFDIGAVAEVAGDELFTVDYNAVSNVISFTFDAAYGNVADDVLNLVSANDGAATLLINAVAANAVAGALAPDVTAFAGNGIDTFVFDAGDTGITLATADTIVDFTTAVDFISTSKVAADATIADGSGFANFADFVAAADAVMAAGAGVDDIYVAYDAAGSGNAWVAVDEDDNGSFDAGDTLITLTGIAAVTDIVVGDFA